MSQMERILYIDRVIHNFGKYITAQNVADYFEVSTRQIKRDIEYMRNRMNAPIIYDASIKAYRYEKEFHELEFAEQDCILAYLTLQSILKSKTYLPLYKENLISNFEDQIPSDYKALSQKISYQLPQAQYINVQFFEAICDSMLNKVCLEIDYTDSKGHKSRRLVEVHHMVNYSGSWYIICFDRDKNLLRTFNIPRISQLSLSHEKFEKHNKDFDSELKTFINSGFGIFYGTKTVNAKIKFSGDSQRIISTQVWHEKQKLYTENESTILELPVASFTEVLGKILSFGRNAVPLEPAELVDLWKNEIKEMGKIV